MYLEMPYMVGVLLDAWQKRARCLTLYKLTRKIDQSNIMSNFVSWYGKVNYYYLITNNYVLKRWGNKLYDVKSWKYD